MKLVFIVAVVLFFLWGLYKYSKHCPKCRSWYTKTTYPHSTYDSHTNLDQFRRKFECLKCGHLEVNIWSETREDPRRII